MTPRATYRLQFGPGFGFTDAAALAPYLAELGVSHVYASPVFAARPGSTHGYDVVDPTRLNPELGDERDFRAMAESLAAHGLGLILDIVPNHMGVGGAANRYWLDVLAWGPASRYARWFDIDWSPAHPGLAGKLLVPVLGEPYGTALAGGALELRLDPDGTFAVWAHGVHALPICPRHYGRILHAAGLDALATAAEAAADVPPEDPRWPALRAEIAAAAAGGAAEAMVAPFRGRPGDPASWRLLDALVADQHWRAARFTLGDDALNYRRFFTISELAGLRVEDPAVFEATHALPLALVGEGLVDGLRIDHVDGLRDPKAYLRRLRDRAARPFYLVVEKILGPEETLPPDWGADGTTGYEFANLAVGLLADPAGTEALGRIYAEFTGRREPPDELVRAAKREIMLRPMAAELEALTARLLRLAAGDDRWGDLGRPTIRAGLVELVAAFDVYRTYADAEGMRPADRARLASAAVAARRQAPWLDPEALAFLEAVLSLEAARRWPDRAEAVLEAAARVQQFTGPVMAKGLEDTALYRYNRLIALNEVGSEPGRLGVSIDAFHAANAARAADEPLAMLATSTHDTKRGEDARARIAALTGHAELWGAQLAEWHALLADPADSIDRNEEHLFYQALLGAWPAEWRAAPPPEELRALRARLDAAMRKVAREAGVNTRWVFGDPEYEARLSRFVACALDPDGAFLASFRGFEAAVAPHGAANALIQTVLKLTVPGVPDIYQGAELWEQSLVDPDNRRLVDFAARADMLARLRRDAAPLRCDAPGKLAVTRALLGLRREKPELFARGGYLPLRAEGPGAAAICAFARRWAGETMLVAVALRRRGEPPDDRTAILPPMGSAGAWRELLTGARLDRLTADTLFATLPAAVALPA